MRRLKQVMLLLGLSLLVIEVLAVLLLTPAVGDASVEIGSAIVCHYTFDDLVICVDSDG